MNSKRLIEFGSAQPFFTPGSAENNGRGPASIQTPIFTRASSHNPVFNMYHINEVSLDVTSAERDLGVIVSDKLSWNKQVCEQCAKSDRMLGFVSRNTRSIKRASVRRSIYLTLVSSHLGYATQV